jgi:hypothetical protein
MRHHFNQLGIEHSTMYKRYLLLEFKHKLDIEFYARSQNGEKRLLAFS